LFFENSQLTKLEVSLLKNKASDPKHERFWKNQTNLKELIISNIEIPFDILLGLLKRHNLSKLELDIEKFSQHPDLIIEMAKDLHWKKLSFKNEPHKEQSCKTIKKIIAAHPCIKKLEFYRTSLDEPDFVISHIYKHIPHIQHLRLPLNYGLLKNNEIIKFEKLKILEIERIESRKICFKF
jgi:hypothetical protein